MVEDQAISGNALLTKLLERELWLLETLDSVRLTAGQVLESRGTTNPSVYFIDSGLVSVGSTVRGNKFIEVGLVGFEGMTGTAVLLGARRSFNEAVALTEGTARRI